MDEAQASFAEEVERVRESGLVGRSGRLRDLFDFLAARGPGAEPASQAEIAETVFGHTDAEADDATARVYVHRLRKRLEQFYDREDTTGGRLVLPAGTYALHLEREGTEPPHEARAGPLRWLVPVLLVLALAAAFAAGRSLPGTADETEANAIWQPFMESERPIMIAVGDYYIFGEIDPLRPEEGRLIRDFAIDSPTDLARAQEADPARYGATQDMGLNYLPFSSAYALRALMPVLAQHPRPVGVMPASQVDSGTLRDFNVIYIGLISGMGLIEEVNFMSSGFAVGESYDELIDVESGRRYVSGEARSLASVSRAGRWSRCSPANATLACAGLRRWRFRRSCRMRSRSWQRTAGRSRRSTRSPVSRAPISTKNWSRYGRGRNAFQAVSSSPEVRSSRSITRWRVASSQRTLGIATESAPIGSPPIVTPRPMLKMPRLNSSSVVAKPVLRASASSLRSAFSAVIVAGVKRSRVVSAK